MANTVLVGAQWGDEGKGKIIDVLTEDVDWVVRYQGGNNAGHTVEIGGTRYVLHLIPSGILRPDKRCIIGNGVVVNPLDLLEEMDGLAKAGVRVDGRLFLSDRAHLVLPYHRRRDAGREARLRAGEKIGTTLRGIGPSYEDKAARTGLRVGDLLDPALPGLLRLRAETNNEILAAHGQDRMDVGAIVSEIVAAAGRLAPHITDTTCLLHAAMDAGEPVLFEGAQGTMLDVDYGTYPFVTSSSCTSGGACTGTGVPPRRIDRVVGVIKAYTTRVGEGPLPTELSDATGDQLRADGREFGATTGRPRRCGWFDAVVARYAARVNGIDSWALTKLDVLDRVPTIRLCTAYRDGDALLESIPANIRTLERCAPVYEDLPGWQTPTGTARTMADLPGAARDYLDRIEALTGVPVGILSLGPGRERTIRITT